MLINFMERLADVFRSRRTLRELSGLSDRELWDIGIVRSEVDGLAREMEA